MKQIILFLTLFFLPTHAASPVAVVLMVRNEAPVIHSTLQLFVDAGVDTFFIFDTGSTDDTIAMTQQFFEQHNLEHAYIEQEPFVDFATSRNRALERAEQHFTDTPFLLMIDAEWYLHNIPALIEFCNNHANDTAQAYSLKVCHGPTSYYSTRLLRRSAQLRYVGVVHEYVNHPTNRKVDASVFFERRTTEYGAQKTRKRWERDLGLLLEEYRYNPRDARTVFYLAQTYDSLCDWRNAYRYYGERVRLGGWAEEQYVAQFRQAQMAHHTIASNESTWETALKLYLKAFGMRPHRAEPLVAIAEYYRKIGDYHTSYVFASRAVELPFPVDDVLFVDEELYDYGRYDLLGIVAWYVDEYERGEWAVRKALAKHPERTHLKTNLACYRQ